MVKRQVSLDTLKAFFETKEKTERYNTDYLRACALYEFGVWLGYHSVIPGYDLFQGIENGGTELIRVEVDYPGRGRGWRLWPSVISVEPRTYGAALDRLEKFRAETA